MHGGSWLGVLISLVAVGILIYQVYIAHTSLHLRDTARRRALDSQEELRRELAIRGFLRSQYDNFQLSCDEKFEIVNALFRSCPQVSTTDSIAGKSGSSVEPKSANNKFSESSRLRVSRVPIVLNLQKSGRLATSMGSQSWIGSIANGISHKSPGVGNKPDRIELPRLFVEGEAEDSGDFD